MRANRSTGAAGRGITTARVNALVDLVLQFDSTEAGRHFIAAWKQARNIIDAGHAPAEKPNPPTPPSP